MRLALAFLSLESSVHPTGLASAHTFPHCSSDDPPLRSFSVVVHANGRVDMTVSCAVLCIYTAIFGRHDARCIDGNELK